MGEKKLSSMVKSIGFRKIKTVIFISGNGSNMKNLIKFSMLKKSPITVDFVLTNNNKAKVLNFLKKKNIAAKIFNFNQKKNTEKKF